MRQIVTASDSPKVPGFTIHITRVVGGISLLAAGLIVASVAGQLLRFLTGHDRALGFIALFDLNEEKNVPTFFSVGLLLGATLLLGVVSAIKIRCGDRYRWQWTGLAAGFGFMAVDESISIHERLTPVFRRLLGGVDLEFLNYAWIVPYAVLVVSLAFIYVPFLFRLPSFLRRSAILAAVLYVCGAIGIETLGGRHDKLHGRDNLGYSALVTLEETLELAGCIVFLWVLLLYIRGQYSGFLVRLVNRHGEEGENPGLPPEVRICGPHR